MKIFDRPRADSSRKTMCSWLAQCADLLKPLYEKAKEVLFESKGDRNGRYRRKGIG